MMSPTLTLNVKRGIQGRFICHITTVCKVKLQSGGAAAATSKSLPRKHQGEQAVDVVGTVL